jgi:hypothetical protein
VTLPRSSSTTAASTTWSRGAPADRPLVPGVDRSQRLRSRHDAHRALRWMTEMTIYRLNRVPDKLHVALWSCSGDPARRPERSGDATALPPARSRDDVVDIRGGATEVATPRSPHGERSSSRSTRTSRSSPLRPGRLRPAAGWPRPGRRCRRRQRDPAGMTAAGLRVRRPSCGDALCLGFDGRRRAGCCCRWTSTPPRPAGPAWTPRTPPLRWEVSQGDNRWEEAEVLEDLTGGFNYGSGDVELQLPERSASSRWRATACTGSAAAWTTDAPAAARRPPTPTLPRSTGSPPRRSAPCLPASHAGRVER